MVWPTAVTDCPTAMTAEERVLDATSDSITVYAEHRDVFAFRGLTLLTNPRTAMELFGWHEADYTPLCDAFLACWGGV